MGLSIFPNNMNMYNTYDDAFRRQIESGNRDAMNLRNGQNVSQLLPPQGNNMMNSIRPQARQFQQQAPKQGLLGKFNNAMGNLPMSGNLGLLAAGASLLEGGKIGDAVQAGFGTYQGLSEMEEKKKRQAAMAKLVEQYGDDPKLMQLLQASPDGGASLLAQLELQKRKQPTTTSAYKNFKIAKDTGAFKGTFFEYQKSLSGKGETTEFQKALGKKDADLFDKIQIDADSGRLAIDALNIMADLTNDEDTYTGFGANVLLNVKRLAVAVGADASKVKDTESFSAFSKDLALKTMGGSLGVGFSNADRDFVIEQVPNIENTLEGNKQLIVLQRKIQERKLDVAELMDKYVEDNPDGLRGWSKHLREWAEANPLFVDNNMIENNNFKNDPLGLR